MFTGLITEVGTIKAIQRNQQMTQLTFQASNTLLRDYRIGDSMAVNGVCLTALTVSESVFKAEIMPETVKRTTFSAAKVGDSVNLERALLQTQRFEGHFVAGHVDTVTRLIGKKEKQNALILTFSYPPAYKGEIIPQGSIAINGVSLTITETTAASFSVSLIPHSKSLTNLGDLAAGALVNIETDIIGKYVRAQENKFVGYKEKDLL